MSWLEILKIFGNLGVLVFKYIVNKQDRNFYDLRIKATNDILKQRKSHFDECLNKKDCNKISDDIRNLLNDIDRINSLR